MLFDGSPAKATIAVEGQAHKQQASYNLILFREAAYLEYLTSESLTWQRIDQPTGPVAGGDQFLELCGNSLLVDRLVVGQEMEAFTAEAPTTR